ncbi:hypothetical protein [Endozoicomonas numazuensis]|uniref:Uncharacterized protein n=1 Tax=Endozoicomonas numazuensis TaxID=1137799 RepID=A0A081NGW6_9GAMM|nr:hypothetical protein [Endozoicomonas numazuensis]KEQ17689.1 hypothetical protein GZ78_08320 [Endozoicomonas numazuensis]
MDGIDKNQPPSGGESHKSSEVNSPKKVKTSIGVLSPVSTEKMLPMPVRQQDQKSLDDYNVHLQSSQSVITENSDSGIGTLTSNSSSALDNPFPLTPDEQLEKLLAVCRNHLGDAFDSRLFLSGRGEAQFDQVEHLAEWLLDNIATLPSDAESGALGKLLTTLKMSEANPSRQKELAPYSFAMRSAILLASEKSGAGIESWETYTKQPPNGKSLKLSDPEFWPWVEKHTSWVPEAQAAFLKYVETAYVTARKLSSTHQDDQVIAYKGGFGAGKTSHGKAAFGKDEDDHPLFAGSIAPDSAKNVMRKTMPLSHGTVHLQGSNMAFNLFDGLIQKSGMGTIIYDTSLSRAKDIDTMIGKSVKAGKPFKVVDIARDDKARMLAVLGRRVDGDDPRIPAGFLLAGASRDRSGRAECLNTVLKSAKTLFTDKKTKQSKELVHSYELHCADKTGSDRQWLVTLKSSESPEWNPNLSKEEITNRLASQGICFNPASGLFESLNSAENWSEVMRKELHKPARTLIKNLSKAEADKRLQQFSGRTIQFDRPMAGKTTEDAYYSMPLHLTQCIPKSAFLDAFSAMEPDSAQQLINDMYETSIADHSISYMDMPVIFTLEFNRYLTSTPSIWPDEEG